MYGLPTRLEPSKLALSVLHINVWLLFSGSRSNVIRLQYQRNMGITLCRQLMSRHGSLIHEIREGDDETQEADKWESWVNVESQRRIIYFTWREMPRVFDFNRLSLTPRSDRMSPVNTI